MISAFSTVREIAAQVRARKVSAREMAQLFLSRIEKHDPRVHSYLYVDREGALKGADEVDARVKGGEDLLLAGVPVGIKDVLTTKGIPTTCGSKVLEGWRPPA